MTSTNPVWEPCKKGELHSADVHDYCASLFGCSLKIFKVASSFPVQL